MQFKESFSLKLEPSISVVSRSKSDLATLSSQRILSFSFNITEVHDYGLLLNLSFDYFSCFQTNEAHVLLLEFILHFISLKQWFLAVVQLMGPRCGRYFLLEGPLFVVLWQNPFFFSQGKQFTEGAPFKQALLESSPNFSYATGLWFVNKVGIFCFQEI